MKSFVKKTIVLTQFLFILAVLFSALLFFTFLYFIVQIPSTKKLDENKYDTISKSYTQDGILIKEYAKTTRHYIPYSEFSPHLIQAFISAEDTHFFENPGIDLFGMFRAIFKNIKNKISGTGGLEGASTITQQLIKNTLLTNEKTFDRKIKEIILSLIITQKYSKEHILELYLNYIFLGENSYGVESAALEYFGKSAKDLSILECATLAAMPKAPSVLNPRANYQKTLARRNWVLLQMYNNRYIDKKTFKELEKMPISHIKEKSNFVEKRYGYNAIADHISRNIIQEVGIKDLFTGGYFIRTTLDSDIQKALFTSVQLNLDNYQKRHGMPLNNIQFSKNNWCNELKKYNYNKSYTYGVALKYVNKYNIDVGYIQDDQCKTIKTVALQHVPYKMGIVMLEKRDSESLKPLRLPKSVIKLIKRSGFIAKPIPQPNAGAVVMNLKSGKILAMVGDYFDTPNGFNRAIQAYRQLGSAVKPFVYQTAFENGYSPASKFIDEPLTLNENWKPKNSSDDYLGSITLRRSLELSRNVPTVRLADALGIDVLKSTFERLDLLNNNAYFGYSSALGSIEVTPLQVARAYSVYPNGGVPVDPIFIDYIQDRDGKTVYQNSVVSCENCKKDDENPQILYKNSNKRLVSKQVSYQITSILEGVLQRGTASHVQKFVGTGVAGKTGTTNDSKDSWFIGFNSDVVIAVYTGFDEPKTLGAHEYGATISLPIFVDTMQAVLKKYPSKPFVMPEGITRVLINHRTGLRSDGTNPSHNIWENMKEGDEIPEYENSSLKMYGY